MPLHPLEFVLQLPERLAVDERDSSELLHHLAHGRLGDGFRSIPFLYSDNKIAVRRQFAIVR